MSDCCSVGVRAQEAYSRCRVCGRKGQPVKRRTLEHMLRGEALARLKNAEYFFCVTATCPVVYFSGEAESLFDKGEVKVRVGLKETEDPVPVCYCFGITERMIRQQIAATGRTTIPQYIREQVRAGRCACEIKNPSGRCCLGAVMKIVCKALKANEEELASEAMGCPRTVR